MQRHQDPNHRVGFRRVYRTGTDSPAMVKSDRSRMPPIARLCAVSFLLAGCARSDHYWHANWDVSPGGEKVIYSADGKVWLRDLSGRSEGQVTDGSDPIFAGTAERVLYSGVDGAIWLLDLESGRGKRITSPGAGEIDRQPAYDRNGKRLYFARLTTPGAGGRFHAWDIFSCRLEGADFVRCTSESFWMLRISPQAIGAGQLWFSEEGPLSDGSPIDFIPHLASMDLSAHHRLAYFPAPEEPSAPAVRSDGTRLAMSEGHPGEYFAKVYNLRDMRPLYRSEESGLVDHPLFVDRGSRILYLNQSEGILSGHLMNEDGKSVVLFKREN